MSFSSLRPSSLLSSSQEEEKVVNHLRLCKVWVTLCTCLWRRVLRGNFLLDLLALEGFENPVTTGCTGVAAPVWVAGA